MYIDDRKLFGLPKYIKVIIAFAGLLTGFILSRLFFIMPFIVQDNSMKPGLAKGDYVLILKHFTPKEGDIVLCKSFEPDKVILKRIIAKGDKGIQIKDKRIFINNTEYIPKHNLSKDSRIFPEYFSNRDNTQHIRIIKGEIFVIGDNIDYSYDSREFGPIAEESIIGKMIYKF